MPRITGVGSQKVYTKRSRQQMVRRPCLVCTKLFYSQWIGHRICDKCKEYRSVYSSATVGVSTFFSKREAD